MELSQPELKSVAMSIGAGIGLGIAGGGAVGGFARTGVRSDPREEDQMRRTVTTETPERSATVKWTPPE